MGDQDRLARLLPTDRLYRKLRIGQWDPATLTVHPEAFIDPLGRALSTYVAGVGWGPRQILAWFCTRSYARRYCPPDRDPTPEDLLDAGEGILELPASEIFRLGLGVRPEPNGNEIRDNGHVNILGAEQFAIELSRAARVLTREEILAE